MSSPNTLTELRALARKLGLRGYAKLPKTELQQRLKKFKTAGKPPTTARKRARAAPGKDRAAPAPAAAAPAKPARIPEPPRTEGMTRGQFSTDEERVESAKFARVTMAAAASNAHADLGEDIDRLPPLRQSMLCVLPQKPGVLHAYWTLADGDGARDDLKLRLCHGDSHRLHVWDEVPIAARHGQWYFHVPENAGDDALLLQLGYYHGDTFVTAIRRGIARIPNLYASSRTDRWWWIDEESFRTMYLRAGGAAHPRGLGWSASIGSPFAPLKRDERLGWPGGVSSRSR